ncbi:MAG: hypothetical protein M3Y58_18340 [Chloroflexota bacterium]|nr:hypothetical protein [Chloroflexota bacterium]
MRYTSKTIEREVVGPFIGKRFPSMSDGVVNALLTVEYRFEGFTITIVGIPARWDRATGAEYVTGKVGREVNARVTTLAAILEGRRQGSIELLGMVRSQPPVEQILQAEGRLNRAQMIAEVLQATPFRVSLNLSHAA